MDIQLSKYVIALFLKMSIDIEVLIIQQITKFKDVTIIHIVSHKIQLNITESFKWLLQIFIDSKHIKKYCTPQINCL